VPGPPPPTRRRRPGGPRTALTAITADLLGVPVGVAIPLQRHHPAAVLAICVGELAALVAVVLVGGPVAWAAFLALAAALVALAATNRHRVLAVTSSGVLVLAASASGRPTRPLGPAPVDLDLPRPRGLGAPVRLDGRTWWVERSAFPRLAQARSFRAGAGS